VRKQIKLVENSHKLPGLMDYVGIKDVFDARNAAICKRLNAVLVSRDRELASKLKGYVRVAEPEELL